MLDLVTAGDAFDDFIFYGLERLPRPGEEVKTSSFARAAGGGAVITAVAAARLGIRCGVATALGTDAVRTLRAEGIRVMNLIQPGEPTAISVAMSTQQDRAFVTFNGVNDRLEARLRRRIPTVRARHVHFALQPRICRRWVALASTLRRQGISTSWDFGWNNDLAIDRTFWSLAAAVDYVFVNRAEAMHYSGTRTLEAALRRWRLRTRCTVVRLGGDGSVALVGDGDVRVPAVRVRTIETTGAGDAFNAGFLAARIRGRDLRAALLLGNRIGALSTRAPGGIAGLPRTGSRA